MYCLLLLWTVTRISQWAWVEDSQSVVGGRTRKACNMQYQNHDNHTNTAFASKRLRSLTVQFLLHITEADFCDYLSRYLTKITYFIHSPAGLLACSHTDPESGSLQGFCLCLGVQLPLPLSLWEKISLLGSLGQTKLFKDFLTVCNMKYRMFILGMFRHLS